MKQTKFLYILLLILLGTSACKKSFLEVPDKTVLLREAYITDLKTTNDYLNGVYVKISNLFFQGYHLIYPELIADNLKPSSSRNLAAQYTWTQTASDAFYTTINTRAKNVNSFWSTGYSLTRDCSYLIENTDKYRGEDEAMADDIKGQAFAFRALVHFVLINTYAQSYSFTPDGSHTGIPYITTSDWSIPVSRETVNKDYEKMIEDLNNALELLPATVKNPLFINRNAVKALLARIYLFKGDYTAAKNMASEVADLVPIMTGADYPSKLFTLQETEALFQLPPASPGAVQGGGDYTTTFPGLYFNGSRLQFNATNDIATILKENPLDSRNEWVTQSGSKWNVSKYPADIVPGIAEPEGAYYQTLFRSSEMYLTAAEAYAILNNEDSARYFLDEIRMRADATLPVTIATGQALLDSIYKERRKELCFEGLRMFDLQRLKQQVNRGDATTPSAQVLPYPSEKAIAPIPTPDIELLGLTQNPGY